VRITANLEVALAATPIIDRECMAETWDDTGADLFIRLAAMFEDEFRQRLAALRDALRHVERDRLSSEAHSLKSAAAYVCAAATRDVARQIERTAPSAEHAELADLVQYLVEHSDLTMRELRAAIAEREAMTGLSTSG
jgi:HPt (histidine-containing phosphotransfer) domain-containing protein